MTGFKLIAYEKENGEVPVEQFLDSVNPIAKDRRKDFIERVMEDENI